ncbi:kinase-like domain-containing protein [Immersiella caudata]|uniref:Kinase-like domain-containing protein n=1 Tax=Immersiella caudata TaxID=314043 RepID=A0AA39XCE1_9PEZI|nr:kinase-like domain-containing protein [Immersiella caudata]
MMGDIREYSEVSEEKTEPFSQSEIEMRLQNARHGQLGDSTSSTVSLDKLVVPPDEDIRILMRPLTRDRSVSPGNQEVCRWLALHAEVAEEEQSEHKVLAVTQTARDISFSVRIPGAWAEHSSPSPPLWCELYYDPASDNQILVNRSHVPFTLSMLSLLPAGSPGEEYDLNPASSKALVPGTWRIKVDGSEVLDFRILEKRPARLRLPSSDSSSASTVSDMTVSVGKRSFVADDEEPLTPEKKPRPTGLGNNKDDGVIMFLPPKTNPLVFPLPTAEKGKEVATSSGHPLLDLQADETVEIAGGCELDEYTITKREPIAASSLSSVFTADYSKVPGNVIVVKVLKTRTNLTATNEALAARNVIHQADIWLRELQYQEDLQHKSIVRLYGGDARFLSLYMEHVDARDLAAQGVWRVMGDLFNGNRWDGRRILHDIASALNYIHGRGLIHNDIKPGNILYSRERGAVLCDLGLSTYAKNPPTTGGTPWYVPPEYIAVKQRGAPSDVWALGVVMLYVTGFTPFPDMRGHRRHPKHLHWQISKVHQHHRDRAGAADAVSSMRQWLNEVNVMRNKLDHRDKLELLIYDMLAPNPNLRITTKDILSRFNNDKNLSKFSAEG